MAHTGTGSGCDQSQAATGCGVLASFGAGRLVRSKHHKTAFASLIFQKIDLTCFGIGSVQVVT